MAEATSHEQKDHEHGESEKKLRKREKRLLDRLEEAYIAQKNAAERFQHAEARLLKRLARTQRLEARLAMLRQQLETYASPSLMVTALNTDTPSQIHDDRTEERPQEENAVPENETDIATKARMARAVAIVAEQAARLAVERALHVAVRLEHMVTGRHLSQELLDLEAQAAQASVVALDAELAAQEAERLASADPITVPPPLHPTSNNEVEDTPSQVTAQNSIADKTPTKADETSINEAMSDSKADEIPTNINETPASKAVGDPNATEKPTEETKSDETATNTHMGLPTPVEQERVEEIEEDEEMVEMVAAMMIADVAAANAAKAESFAEEASACTAEARRLAQEADTVLERIRAAIRNGTSSGDAAEAILFDAERDATRTHAILADAEATEERARRVAMEAEAEAEVAEGMAFAVEDRNEDDEIQREDEPSSSAMLEGQHTGDTGEIERLAKNMSEKRMEDEDTIEVPIVRPQL